MALVIPEHYDPVLSVRETQEAIKFIRDLFQKEFGRQMNLERVSAPLFVTEKSGLNDNLNGVERPVNFDLLSLPGENIEVVQSLAKWKRLALKRYRFKPGEGLYTNMNAIRRDETPDNLHSFYVDQWDWERVLRKEDRSLEVLEDTVQRIYTIIKHMQHEVWYKYPDACYRLPREITFITSEELLKRYPKLSPKERENAIARVRELHGATNPANAADGTIRKRFAKNGSENAVHASDSPESAAREVHIFFSETEIF